MNILYFEEYVMERKSRNQILREVRERITSGNYAEIQKLRSISSTDTIVILGDKRLDEKDIFDYYEKVLDLVTDEESELCALGKLVNIESFDIMDEDAKQRYILNLSKLYLSLKEDIKSKK